MDTRYALCLRWCFQDTLRGEHPDLRKHLSLSTKEMAVVMRTPVPNEAPPASLRMDSAVRLAASYSETSPHDLQRIAEYSPSRVVMDPLAGCKHPSKEYTHD